MARPIAKDHDQKRGHILSKAAQVFAADGVAGASMAQVAKACGISKANIYHYYGSKDALLFDILDSYLSALRDTVCGVSLDGLDAPKRLRVLVRETLLAYEGMDAEHQIQTEGIPLLSPDQQTVLKGYQRDMVSVFGQVIKDAAKGALDQDRHALRTTTMAVFGMLNWFYIWNAKADREERLRYADLVTDLTLGGVIGMAAKGQGNAAG